ncbi:MAG: NAD(P)/FAD-dependent oxidoreductase [Pyrinomonadaceae bacterium]
MSSGGVLCRSDKNWHTVGNKNSRDSGLGSSRNQRDVVIIGGGPAGMSAAVWCADLGLKPLLVERETDLGGQLFWTHNPITNYLGSEAANGTELALEFAEHVRRSGIEMMTAAEVRSVDLSAKSVDVGGESFAGKAIVIATGVRRRKLGIPGEEELYGLGILLSGARDRAAVAGKTVVIVGGGDAAMENALILSEVAREVFVVHRRDRLSAREVFVEAARARSNVEFILDSTLEDIRGGDSVGGVTLRTRNGETFTLACEAVLIRIGVDPNTDLFADQVETDERGYIVVDKELRTSVDAVWAIGDIATPRAMTVANAVGAGSVAAKSIAESL